MAIYIIKIIFLNFLCAYLTASHDDLLNSNGEEPEFIEQIKNTTVSVGRSVTLSCSVKNLGSFKVAWMHYEQSAILTVNNHVITRNPRITVTHDKHRTWNLHISNIQEADRGRYMCQLNTISAKTQFGYLNVVVPPNIEDSYSSSDHIAREGSNVTLNCHATGFPPPVIKWRRDDGLNITINKTLVVNEWEGNQLPLIRISRLDMGAYLCIASNSVPPSVSKRIKVSVDFPPQLLIPHQLISVTLGYNVTLECFTEAHPASLNYWTRGNNNQMLHDSKKYRSESESGIPAFKTRMRLTILYINKEDLGVYKCVAKNARGETEGTIRLYATEPKTTIPPPTTASTATTRKYYIDTEFEEKYDTENDVKSHKKGHKNRKNPGSSLNEIDKFEHKSIDKNVNIEEDEIPNNAKILVWQNRTLIIFIIIGAYLSRIRWLI